MGVHISHLVFEALSHTNYEVVDDGLDRSESRDIFSGAVVDLDGYFSFRRE
jgi:hypothetical protein